MQNLIFQRQTYCTIHQTHKNYVIQTTQCVSYRYKLAEWRLCVANAYCRKSLKSHERHHLKTPLRANFTRPLIRKIGVLNRDHSNIKRSNLSLCLAPLFYTTQFSLTHRNCSNYIHTQWYFQPDGIKHKKNNCINAHTHTQDD